MRGLILQLAKLDSEAEAQVRVVAFFDALLRSRATLESVLRATAGLTGVTVGVTLSSTGEIIGFDAQGHKLGLAPQALAELEQRMVVSRGREVARVWMQDSADTSKIKLLVLERLVLTCEVLWATDDIGTESLALERLLNPATSEQEREQVHGLLQSRFPHEIRSVCIQPSGDKLATGAWYSETELSAAQGLGIHRNQLLSARWDSSLWLVVDATDGAKLTGLPRSRMSVGPRVGLRDAGSSGRLALAALRFSGQIEHPPAMVSYDDIGPMCLLNVRGNDTLASDPFIRAVLSTIDQNPESEVILTALATHGSIRAAAKNLHMHHSSVASRIDKFEAQAALSVREPSSLFSLRLALAYWKTRESADLLTPVRLHRLPK